MTINRIADRDQTAGEPMPGSRFALSSQRAAIAAGDIRSICVVRDLVSYRSSDNLGLLTSENDGFTGLPPALLGRKMV